MLLTVFPLLLLAIIQVQQIRIQQTMKEHLLQKDLITVVIAEKDVQWIKKDKEILVGRKMFDIKSFRLDKGRYFFTGLYDNKETALNSMMEKGHAQEKKSGNQLLVQLFSLLQSPCISHYYEINLTPPVSYNLFHIEAQPLLFRNTDILTPPPQV